MKLEGGDIYMKNEREILSQEKAIIMLEPKRSSKAKLLKGFSVLGGAVGAGLFAYLQIKQDQKHLSPARNVFEGDISDIIGGSRKGRLAMTNNHIVLHYQVGFRKKTDKMLAFALQYAKSVEEIGRLNKCLQIRFEIPTEDKPISFNLKIWVKNREQWIKKLTCLIQ